VIERERVVGVDALETVLDVARHDRWAGVEARIVGKKNPSRRHGRAWRFVTGFTDTKSERGR
jgi:hypothetical protein